MGQESELWPGLLLNNRPTKLAVVFVAQQPSSRDFLVIGNLREEEEKKMTIMGKLRMFVVQEPVVAASCLIAGFGLFLPAVVRPILDSFESSKQVPPPALSDVVAGMTGKKQG